MRLQYQRIPNHNPKEGRHGDCFRTCIAILLGLDAEEVPNFSELEYRGEGGCDDLAQAWLQERGYTMLVLNYISGPAIDAVIRMATAGQPFILVGASPRFEGINHCVIAKNNTNTLWCPVVGEGEGKNLKPWTYKGNPMWSVCMIVRPVEPLCAASPTGGN